MLRRQFLTASLATSAIAGQAWSATSTDQRLLVIFLRGGYDAINVIPPISNELYYASRPSISIARPDPTNANAALPLDADWGLHPALNNSIYPLWQQKQVAFVPFAGTEDMTRSHFETQDTIELGQPSGRPRDYQSGFMARLAEQVAGARPIAFTSQPPLTFRSSKTIPNFSIASLGKPGIDARQASIIKEMYRGHELEMAVLDGFSTRDKAYAAIAGEMIAADRKALPTNSFEITARRVGRMMRADYNLAFLDVGGWDTHVNQGGASGILSDRIGQLGKGLGGLIEEIGQTMWRNTVVVIISEFGRTFKENGNKGTDHGHGSIYWVIGGSVNGGQIAGEQVLINQKNLNQGRDLPVLTDYRVMISSIAQRLYGLRPDQIAKIFPGAPTTTVGLSLL